MRAAPNQGTQSQFTMQVSQSPPLPKRSERDCRDSGGERSPEPFVCRDALLAADIANALNALALPQPLELLAGHDGAT
jgi:hypothetical protein